MSAHAGFDQPGGSGRAVALAPAKVNPWLAVLGTRDDGFHELDTGLIALDWCDRIEVCASELSADAADDPERAVALTLAGPQVTPDIPADGRNLAYRAARAVLERARRSGAVPASVGLEVRLEKQLPSRAGLGGGSADAVAAALAAAAALGTSLAQEELVALATELGSDTVFFAAAGTGYARCTGRGERVQPLELPVRSAAAPWCVAVVTPGVEASTAAVFGALAADTLQAAQDRPRVAASFLDLPLDSLRSQLFNDLEPAALAAVPELREWRRVLDRAGAEHFRLSGSGSSFFGLFEGADQASQCLAEIASLAGAQGLRPRASRVARPAGHAAVLR